MLYMNAYEHLLYVAEFFLAWEMSQSCSEHQNTYFMFQQFFPENRAVYDEVEKYAAAREATDDKIWRRKDAICMRGNNGQNTRTHTHTHL